MVRRIEERIEWMPTLASKGGGAIHRREEHRDYPFADLQAKDEASCPV